MRQRRTPRRTTTRKSRFEKKMDDLIADIEEFADHEGDVDHLVESVRDDIADYLAAEAPSR